MAIELERVTGALGAEVHGLDLREPLPAATAETLRRALVEHQVLFFRDQPIEPEHHLALAKVFGEPRTHPAYPSVEGFEAINILESTPERPTKIELWHCDMTFLEQPPLGSILRARVVPSAGGDTLFSSAHGAYDALSPRLQRYLEGLTAQHSFAQGFRESLAEPGGWERLGPTVEKNPPVNHPVVRTHPVTGRKSIFVNPLFTTQINDVPATESAAILRYLYEQQEHPELTCRFRWRADSIAFWDNRSTLHRPVNDYFPAHRKMERITIEGDRPR